MTEANPRLGIALMAVTMFIFAVQDGISRYLADEYNVYVVVMIRYWFLLIMVLAIAQTRPGGIRAAARSKRPLIQLFRGMLLALEIVVTVLGFVYLGLIETHALFAIYPLMIAALSGPILAEPVGWRRWAAIGVGFIGMLIILQPGFRVFSPLAIIPLTAAFMFALYGLTTRYVARLDDSFTSFFWTGIGGALIMTLIGPFFWEPIRGDDIWIMGILCITGAAGHFLLIKVYQYAAAGTVQPFAYLQLVFVSIIGVAVFNETLLPTTVLGAGIIVAAGIYTLFRERQRARSG